MNRGVGGVANQKFSLVHAKNVKFIFLRIAMGNLSQWSSGVVYGCAVSDGGCSASLFPSFDAKVSQSDRLKWVRKR